MRTPNHTSRSQGPIARRRGLSGYEQRVRRGGRRGNGRLHRVWSVSGRGEKRQGCVCLATRTGSPTYRTSPALRSLRACNASETWGKTCESLLWKTRMIRRAIPLTREVVLVLDILVRSYEHVKTLKTVCGQEIAV